MLNDYFSSFTKIRQASKAFLAFMKHGIAVRAKEVKAGSGFAEEHADAFTILVRANEQETGKLKLSDEEVVRTDVYITRHIWKHTVRLGTSSSCFLQGMVKNSTTFKCFLMLKEMINNV